MKTLIEFFDSSIMRLCLLIAGGMIGLASYNWICWSSLTPSDWGTWFGAVGTIGTLIGTIILANRQTSERQRTELNYAALVAAGILPGVSNALYIANATKMMILQRIKDGTPQQYLEQAHRLRPLCGWDANSIVALCILPNDTTFHLENARSRIQFVAGLLETRAATVARDELVGENTVFTDHVDKVLAETVESLRTARVELMKIVPDRSDWA